MRERKTSHAGIVSIEAIDRVDLISALIICALMKSKFGLEDDAPLGYLVHEVARLMKRRFEEEARLQGVTLTQWRMLAQIGQRADFRLQRGHDRKTIGLSDRHETDGDRDLTVHHGSEEGEERVG